MKNLRKFLSLLLVLCMALSTIAGAAETVSYSGTVGDSDVTWSLDEATGRLIISGSGETETFRSKADQPWAQVRDQIKEVWFYGMEDLAIPDLAYWFTDCVNLVQAELPYTTPVIGTDAFANCPSLERLLLYYSAEYPFSICDGAFHSDTEVDTAIYYISDEESVLTVLHGYEWGVSARHISFYDVYLAVYLGGECGISNACTCGDDVTCDWYYDYRSISSTQHRQYIRCTVCNGASFITSDQSHTFSGNTCTLCGYTTSSSGGGDTGGDTGCSHGSYTYSYDYYNTSYHTYTKPCRYCGEEISSSLQSHSWQYSYSAYSSSQHKVTATCSGCGYSTTSYAAHSDSDGDGKCDACGTSMGVTVTWNASANGGTVNGSGSVSTTVASGSVAAAPSYTPVKTGYTFKGWYTSSNGGSLYNTVTVTAARTFYAQFTATNYTITWNHGDGTTSTTSQAYGSNLVLPSTPVRAGYTFDGWFTASSGGTQVTSSTVYATASASTYYAHWTAKSYTITWDLGDGRTETTSQTYGEKLTLPSTPTRTGYAFDGWFTAETGGTQVTGSTSYTKASNTTYYAQWTGNTYTITWDLGDGTTKTTSQVYGDKLVLPAVTPTKAGHTFSGWYTAATGGSKVTGDTVYTSASATTYYAQFTPNQYTIIWNLGDGRTETTNQTYGENLTLPAMPIRDGYTFLGWYTAESGGTEVTGNTVYTAAAASTYYAQWELIPVFSVTVPVIMPLAVAEDGTVHTADDLEIQNASTGDVVVTAVTVTTANGWTLVPFTADMAREKVDARLVGFSLNGMETTIRGSAQDLALTGDWTVQKDGALALEYGAVLSALSQPVTEQAILSVVFVLQWA